MSTQPRPRFRHCLRHCRLGCQRLLLSPSLRPAAVVDSGAAAALHLSSSQAPPATNPEQHDRLFHRLCLRL